MITYIILFYSLACFVTFYKTIHTRFLHCKSHPLILSATPYLLATRTLHLLSLSILSSRYVRSYQLVPLLLCKHQGCLDRCQNLVPQFFSVDKAAKWPQTRWTPYFMGQDLKWVYKVRITKNAFPFFKEHFTNQRFRFDHYHHHRNLQ